MYYIIILFKKYWNLPFTWMEFCAIIIVYIVLSISFFGGRYENNQIICWRRGGNEKKSPLRLKPI